MYFLKTLFVNDVIFEIVFKKCVHSSKNHLKTNELSYQRAVSIIKLQKAPEVLWKKQKIIKINYVCHNIKKKLVCLRVQIALQYDNLLIF